MAVNQLNSNQLQIPVTLQLVKHSWLALMGIKELNSPLSTSFKKKVERNKINYFEHFIESENLPYYC